MTPQVLRRFIILMFTALVLVGLGTLLLGSFTSRLPGDYETERGDMYLSTHDYDKAMGHFEQALKINPDHRGARMGRAVVLIARKQHADAVIELTQLIKYLRANFSADDATGRGTLAAAYGNLGIVHDRSGRHKLALENYINALKVDADAVEGPGIVHKILYNPAPSTIRKRARYLYQELQKPLAEQVLSMPELDAKSRTYKP